MSSKRVSPTITPAAYRPRLRSLHLLQPTNTPISLVIITNVVSSTVTVLMIPLVERNICDRSHP